MLVIFQFVVGKPAVSPVLEEEVHLFDEVPNILLLDPSHVDTVSAASYHTALTRDKKPEHPTKVKQEKMKIIPS